MADVQHSGSNPLISTNMNTRVMELVDIAVLETVADRLESSSLSLGTIQYCRMMKLADMPSCLEGEEQLINLG